MRTTLDIDEDVLKAARELARQKGITMGKALSNLARQSLTRRVEAGTRNDVPFFPQRPDAKIVTLEIVNELRDETA